MDGGGGLVVFSLALSHTESRLLFSPLTQPSLLLSSPTLPPSLTQGNHGLITGGAFGRGRLHLKPRGGREKPRRPFSPFSRV